MKVEILGTETLGVRGLSTFIDTAKVLIDPGVALGFSRYHLHPHPIQAVVGDEVRARIIGAWKRAGDIIISHFHGDHIPLANPNPFQLGIDDILSSHSTNSDVRIWVKAERFCKGIERRRLRDLKRVFGSQMVEAEPSRGDGLLEFIGPFQHTGNSDTLVLGTLIRGEKTVLHLSDADIFSEEVARAVSRVNPDIVISDGPSIYRHRFDGRLVDDTLSRASRLADSCGTWIIDHHLMRCDEGIKWLNSLRKEKGECKILSAADFMMRPLTMLEAWRRTLYKLVPVSNEWFRDYSLMKGLKRNYKDIWPEIEIDLGRERPNSEKEFEGVLRYSLERIDLI